jgi:coenzyme F420-reducing hydrogenase delta subunit
VRPLQAPDTAVASLLCAGQLPPSFVEYALREGADGVLVTGCRECDCAFRLGDTWTEQRMRGEREPHLRRTVSSRQLRVVWTGSDRARIERELAQFREQLVQGDMVMQADAESGSHA